LALSNPLPWGDDAWRLIGEEKFLISEGVIQPVLFGVDARWREVAGIDLPEVFLIPQKYTYSFFWASGVLTAKVFGADLVDINKWLVPVLWSIFLSVLIFRLGSILFENRRAGLLLLWFSLVPFS